MSARHDQPAPAARPAFGPRPRPRIAASARDAILVRNLSRLRATIPRPLPSDAQAVRARARAKARPSQQGSLPVQPRIFGLVASWFLLFSRGPNGGGVFGFRGGAPPSAFAFWADFRAPPTVAVR